MIRLFSRYNPWNSSQQWIFFAEPSAKPKIIHLEGKYSSTNYLKIISYKYSQHQLPKSNIDPFTELEANFAKPGNLSETQVFVQADAFLVRQRDTGYGGVDAILFQAVEQGGI